MPARSFGDGRSYRWMVPQLLLFFCSNLDAEHRSPAAKLRSFEWLPGGLQSFHLTKVAGCRKRRERGKHVPSCFSCSEKLLGPLPPTLMVPQLLLFFCSNLDAEHRSPAAKLRSFEWLPGGLQSFHLTKVAGCRKRRERGKHGY